MAGKFFADKTVEKCAQNVLFKILSVDRPSDIIDHLPYLVLQPCSLLNACHF